VGLALTGVSAIEAIKAPAANAAGSWIRALCENPDHSPAPSEGMSSFTTGTPGASSNNTTHCAPGSPMVAGLSWAAPAAVGTSETLQYTPPAGSTLAGGTLSVGLSADGRGMNASGVAAVYTPALAYDASNVVIQCAAGLAPCSGTTNDYAGTVVLPANRGGSLFLSASCGGNPGFVCDSAGSHGAWSLVLLGSANLLLRNDTVPAAADFSGSLLEPGAHGSASVAFTASDPGGPGVLRVTGAVDGQVLASLTPNTNAGRCVPVATDAATGALIFDWQQPCPQSVPVILTLDLSSLADGPHQLKITVTNAAQNTSTVLNQTINTSNRTTISGKLTRAPHGEQPVYAIVLDRGTQRLMHRAQRGWRHSALTLSGTLHTAAGVPAPGVALTLLTRTAGHDATRAADRAVSDAAGHFALRAPRGPSRALTIAYGPQPQGSDGPGVVTIHETVTPALALHVALPGHGRVRFTGRLKIRPLGKPRPLVVLEVLNHHGRWQSLGSPVRVSAWGRYTLRYDGGSSVIGKSYSFRAVAPATRLYAIAISPIRKAVVR
jgi:hypothetical protein